MQDKVYAGFFVRLAAYIIDIIIVNAGLFVFKLISLFSWNTMYAKNIIFSFSMVDIISFLVTSAYFVMLTYLSGQTIGKMLLNIKVESTIKESPSFIDILIRETVGRYICTLILFIGYIFVGITEKKQGVHDMICDTEVIYQGTIKNKRVEYNEINRYSEQEKNSY